MRTINNKLIEKETLNRRLNVFFLLRGLNPELKVSYYTKGSNKIDFIKVWIWCWQHWRLIVRTDLQFLDYLRSEQSWNWHFQVQAYIQLICKMESEGPCSPTTFCNIPVSWQEDSQLRRF